MKKSLGQHWLVDAKSLEYICQAADLSPSDLVLEIGPGSGNLTRLLVTRVAQIIAVEVDKSLAGSLDSLAFPNVQVVNQDILKYDLNSLPMGYKIVANIPYYLTSKLIRQISESSNRLGLVILLVQKEIAERLSAQPGDLSILGITCQYFWKAEKLNIVSADKFNPPPKVDSQIARLTPKAELPLDADQQKKLFQLVRIGFASKRKTILNNLSSGYHLNKQETSRILELANIKANTRPQQLSVDNWLEILDKLGSITL